MLDFVVEFEHPPELCPHSNAMVRNAFEDAVQGGALEALAKRLGIEIVFAGIAVAGYKTYMVLRFQITRREDSLSLRSIISTPWGTRARPGPTMVCNGIVERRALRTPRPGNGNR